MKTEILSDATALLDPQVLSAFVVSIFTAMTAFFSWLANRKRSTERKKLRADQLVNLYEPLDYLLNFKPSANASETLANVQELVKNQYRFLTPDIQDALKDLLSRPSVNAEDLTTLKSMVSSVYNWMRRSLGYPYSKKNICYEYLPKPISTLYSFWDYLCWIICTISVILGIAAIVFVFSLIPNQIYETFTSLLLILLIGMVLYISVLTAIQLPKILKNRQELDSNGTFNTNTK